MLSELVAFVPTTDPARASEFYAGTLGLELEDESPFALVFRVNGTMLRVTVVAGAQPQPFTVLGWDGAGHRGRDRARCRERGVAFERYDGVEQDGRGVWSAPGGARIAWFKDPDGNTLSLAQLTG